MYVAVKGGEKAIRAAHALQEQKRRGDGRLPELSVEQIGDQLSLAVESSAKYLVPHLFAAFRAQHPEVSLQLVVVNHAQAVRRLSVSRDDLLTTNVKIVAVELSTELTDDWIAPNSVAKNSPRSPDGTIDCNR